ncbi:hypothetical protein B9Z55_023486 [Caenorhabditis nigoni]|uniref:Uncharacterized protein n=1 Tax=Caenorhabditis nigoni TaxID=1611254 RepID=A0A2G5SQE5_9PELO|nr:hypothetical protein B9Z55_023486 [Caenorhabditis nigoni]
MSTILEPQSENVKRTMLYGYFKKGLSPEVAVENLIEDFPAITRQKGMAWFARFRAGILEIGENISINAEGIVVDRSVRIKRELEDAEQADGEPPARMNPNPVIVPKREVDEVDGENQHPQGNAVANHVVAQQQPAPHVVPTVAFNQNPANPANRDPQVAPKIEGEDRDGVNPAQANRVNEVNRAPEIDRNQREARARPVRRVQRAVAIPPQNPVHPVPIQPGMHPVNLANHFPLAPPPFPIAPQLLPNLPLNQLAIQFPLLFGPQQVMNPQYIGAALGLPMWNQAGNIGQLQKNQVAVDNNHLDEDELPQHQEMAGQQNQVAVDNNHLEEDDSEEDDLEGDDLEEDDLEEDELPQLQELAAQQNQVAVNNNHQEEDDLEEDELPQHRELVAQRNRVAQNLRFRKIEICLGNGTVALCQCQTWEDELETLFIEKDEGCTIKRGPHQLESPDHFIDCAIDELKRITANNGVEIKQLKVSCNQHVTSTLLDIIIKPLQISSLFENCGN